jgi:hypothetical protein
MEKMEQWYNVSELEIVKQHGAPLIQRIYPNLHTALRNVFPEFNWQQDLFKEYKAKELSYWNDTLKHKQVFDSLCEKFNIQKQEDWYSIKHKDFITRESRDLLYHIYGSLHAALEAIYPQFEWHPWKFDHVSRVSHLLMHVLM